MIDVRELLDGIEKRAELATPGPWVADANAVRPSSPAWECLALTCPTGSTPDPQHRSNAQFIAHARTAVPRLVAALLAVLDAEDAGAWRTGVTEVRACEHET